jgi:hypothetical protein
MIWLDSRHPEVPIAPAPAASGRAASRVGPGPPLARRAGGNGCISWWNWCIHIASSLRGASAAQARGGRGRGGGGRAKAGPARRAVSGRKRP